MSLVTVDRLIETYTQVASTNRTNFDKLRAVLSLFRRHGVDCILLKGADLIPRLYGVMGLRAMIDVDLLVDEQNLSAVDNILRNLGYRQLVDGNPAYVDPENTLIFDLITTVWYLDDQEAIWRRAVARDLDGIPVKGMGANDLLLYLTAYNVIHRGYLSASFGLDVALLLEKEPMDWAFILSEARRHHVTIPLYHGLSYVMKHMHASAPDEVIQSLAPATRIEKLNYFIFQRLVTEEQIPELGHLLLFLTQPRRKKWRWLRQSFFPSEAFLKCRYGAQWDRKLLMTRLVRPIYLLSQVLRLAFRVVAALLFGRRIRKHLSA